MQDLSVQIQNLSAANLALLKQRYELFHVGSQTELDKAHLEIVDKENQLVSLMESLQKQLDDYVEKQTQLRRKTRNQEIKALKEIQVQQNPPQDSQPVLTD